jgi:hypothetical protein
MPSGRSIAMTPSAKTFYKVLEVDSEASPEVIEAAYRRLARRYHPDLNPNQDTTGKMQQLNEAFGVLRDSQQRMSYDLYLRAQVEAQARQTATTSTASTQTQPNTTPPPAPASEEDVRTSQSNPYAGATSAMPTACQECGRSDASLRFSQFPFVISVVLVTFRRGDGGLYCTACRRNKMTSAKVLTFLFGWWGIPWGPIYTLGTLFTSSEGVMDA